MINYKLKNKTLLKIICLVLLFAIVTSSILLFCNNSSTPVMADGKVVGGTESAMDIGNNGQSIYDPMQFMKNKYAGKKNLSIIETYSKKLNVNMFSQSSLNYNYNTKYNANINGTCGIVALSTLTYYFSQNLLGYDNLPDNINDIFAEYVHMYGITGSEGTYADTFKNTLKEYFGRYGYNMNTERTTVFYKFTKMRDHVDGNRPTVISVWGSEPYGSHAMLVVGYKKYQITYKSGLINKKVEETMFMIDEGWGRGRVAYLNEKSMPKEWEITNIYRA